MDYSGKARQLRLLVDQVKNTAARGDKGQSAFWLGAAAGLISQFAPELSERILFDGNIDRPLDELAAAAHELISLVNMELTLEENLED